MANRHYLIQLNFSFLKNKVYFLKTSQKFFFCFKKKIIIAIILVRLIKTKLIKKSILENLAGKLLVLCKFNLV